MAKLVWTFRTKHLEVRLCRLTWVRGYKYDGDDADGSTQRALDEGEMVAFDSSVEVYWYNDANDGDGEAIGRAELGSSVYYTHQLDAFHMDHWRSDYDNRNTLELKAKHTAICHYFPDMVRQACAEAREHLRTVKAAMPRIRNEVT